jgi:phage virion morphogenesis protein
MPVAIDIHVDNASLQRLQTRLRRIQHLPLGGLLEGIASEIASQTKRRISTEKTSPEGVAWAAWSPKYAAKRHSGQSLLMGEGNLVDDIQYQVSGNEGVVGSSLIYAATHQIGDDSRNIKARPFLGISSSNETALLRILDDWADMNI